MSEPPAGGFLHGLDDVAAYFAKAGDDVHHVAEGLQITRFIDGRARLVRLQWSVEEGVAAFLAGSVLSRFDEAAEPRLEHLAAALNAELVMPGLIALNGRLSSRTYAFFNHDGSLSTRVVESCVRLAISIVELAEERAREALSGTD